MGTLGANLVSLVHEIRVASDQSLFNCSCLATRHRRGRDRLQLKPVAVLALTAAKVVRDSNVDPLPVTNPKVHMNIGRSAFQGRRQLWQQARSTVQAGTGFAC